jgi:hypothetical protein
MAYCPEIAPRRAAGDSTVETTRTDVPRRNAMLFFVWYDDSPKKLTTDKLQEAIAAYIERFRIHPTLVLINAVDQLERTDITVRSERTVQPNTFWLGHEDHGDLAPA